MGGRRHATLGFTLIELLVVIGIIGILVSMLTTALYYAKRNAKRTQIKTELNMIAASIRNYKHEYGAWPATNITGRIVLTNNYVIFDYMRAPTTNPRGIQFMNWNEVFTTNTDGLRVSVADYSVDHDRCTVVDPWRNPYVLVIDFDRDLGTVRCTTPYSSSGMDPPAQTF